VSLSSVTACCACCSVTAQPEMSTSPLNDPAYFAKVTVDQEAGTLVWPDGIDLAPEPLYEQAKAHPLLAV
jgi:hypothetical protein